MIKRTIGLIIIAVGMLLLLSNLDIINFESIAGFVFSISAIIVGVLGLVEKRNFDFVLSLLVVVGTLYLLNNLDIIDGQTMHNVIGPIIVVGIGLSFLFCVSKSTTHVKSVTNYIALFSGVEDKNESKEYISSDITAIFGGAEVDYRKIKFANDVAYINVTSVFGGATIFIPEDVKVTVKGIPLFGGADNKAVSNSDSKKELVINYVVAFGGVEIKN